MTENRPFVLLVVYDSVGNGITSTLEQLPVNDDVNALMLWQHLRQEAKKWIKENCK